MSAVVENAHSCYDEIDSLVYDLSAGALVRCDCGKRYELLGFRKNDTGLPFPYSLLERDSPVWKRRRWRR